MTVDDPIGAPLVPSVSDPAVQNSRFDIKPKNSGANDVAMAPIQFEAQIPAKQALQPVEIAEILANKYGMLMYAVAKGNEEAWRENLLRVSQVSELKPLHLSSSKFNEIQS